MIVTSVNIRGYQIKRAWIKCSHALAVIVLLLALLSPIVPKALASGNPTITGGSAVTGLVGQATNITDLQITASGNPTVPVTLRVTNGTLLMTNETGLTFSGSDIGSTIEFSGSVSDVNAALASLQYTRSSLGSDTLEMTLVASNQVYDPNNGHLYEFVDGPVTWNDAYTAANSDTYNGLSGYLATVTSSDENAYLNARLPNGGWIGASDAATEGQWKWIDGPENGTLFYTGNGGLGTGAMVSGQYSNWNNAEPNDSGGNEDCAQFLSGGTGKWNDLQCNSPTLPYVVEYGSPGNLPSVVFKDVSITTTGPTDNVTTCAQLEALGTNNANQYDTINLANDIDCTGLTVVPLFSNSTFYGTFNGHNHTIKGFNLNDPSGGNDGLFYYSDGATFENVKLTNGSVIGNDEVGSVVGEGDNSDFTNINSDWVITSTAYYAGGLLGGAEYYDGASHVINNVSTTGEVSSVYGYAGGLFGWLEPDDATTVTIQHSSSTSNVSSSSGEDVGGLVGWLETEDNGATSSTIIEDSYSRGNISTTAYNVGGLVGYIDVCDSGTSGVNTILRRVYASGNVSANSGVGGLVGEIDTSCSATSLVEIDNSFAADAITYNNVNESGALIGDNEANSVPIVSNNNYFDENRAGISVCSNVTSISGCTAVNAAGAQPNYFFDNSTSPPLNTWDFSSIWVHNDSDWPSFGSTDDSDGIPGSVENAAPNGGDANGDGIADSSQGNVASFVDTVNGHYVSVAVDSQCSLNAVSSQSEASTLHPDSGFDYPNGLVGYQANCGTNGYAMTLHEYYYGITSAGLIARAYNTLNSSYSAVSGATITTTTIGGQSVVELTLHLTDGSSLDEDGTANGVIVDPIGLAKAVVGIPNTGLR